MRTYMTLLVVAAGLTQSAAASVIFDVSLDTAPLAGNPSGPFSIDFQLIGDQGTYATVDSFSFGGGSAAGAPNCFGNCSGDLWTAVGLNAASGFYSEFFQAFNPGAILGFRVRFDNVSPPAAGGPDSPDGFSFAILDNSLNEIPMMAGNGSFVTIALDDPAAPSYAAYSNDPASGIGSTGLPTVQLEGSAVPEPATMLLTGLALLAAGVGRRR